MCRYGYLAVATYLTVYVCTLLALFGLVRLGVIKGPDINKWYARALTTCVTVLLTSVITMWRRLKEHFPNQKLQLSPAVADFGVAWLLTKTTGTHFICYCGRKVVLCVTLQSRSAWWARSSSSPSPPDALQRGCSPCCAWCPSSPRQLLAPALLPVLRATLSDLEENSTENRALPQRHKMQQQRKTQFFATYLNLFVLKIIIIIMYFKNVVIVNILCLQLIVNGIIAQADQESQAGLDPHRAGTGDDSDDIVASPGPGKYQRGQSCGPDAPDYVGGASAVRDARISCMWYPAPGRSLQVCRTPNSLPP
jgi:hypothetical protein